MRAIHPVWAVLVAVAIMFAQVFGGTLPVTLLLDSDHPLYQLLGTAGITLAAFALIYLVRRFLHRRPWRGVGLARPRTAVPHLLAGVVAGALAVAVSSLVSVALGVAAWVPWDVVRPALPYLPLGIVLALLGQAFPEELLWRGHLFDILSDRLSPVAVLAVTSVVFGALHIISQSPADTVAERLLYVVQAIALGFACGAARARTGTVWMAVGVHFGLHIGNRVLPVQEVAFGVQLVIITCALAAAGGVILLAGRRRQEEGLAA
ncbi:type II CAAX endopeptidase family protein [Nonomuraea sp. B1E8]|uniref:CPBP family intramembrane glutamic endopeptidase n=1 Tax=unclassified Nonomuraea TaxID=2593643 RepID=UPI00325E63F5